MLKVKVTVLTAWRLAAINEVGMISTEHCNLQRDHGFDVRFWLQLSPDRSGAVVPALATS